MPTNAATDPHLGRSKASYGAPGGPQHPPLDSNASALKPSGGVSISRVPDTEQLTTSLLGPGDLPYDSNGYKVGAPKSTPACLEPLVKAPGSSGQATMAYFRSPEAAPGGNTYPAGGPGTPTNPVAVIEHLASYPPSAIKGAYQSDVAALASCKQLSITIASTPLSATGIKQATGPQFGNPTTAFVANVDYKGTPLHADMAVGVVGDVLAMVATTTSGPPLPAHLSTYTSKALNDIHLHIHS